MSAYTDAADWCESDTRPLYWRTTAPLRWEVGCKGSRLWFDVKTGTPFNVSRPHPIARAFVNPNDPRYRKAACLHDVSLKRGWSRTAAAGMFADALAADGVGRWRRFAMTVAVIWWNWK